MVSKPLYPNLTFKWTIESTVGIYSEHADSADKTTQVNTSQKKPHFVVLLLLFLIVTCPAYSQAIYSSSPDRATLYPSKRSAFENYVFILNGDVIEQETLLHTPGAKLNNVFPYPITLDEKRYQGAVYFHTASVNAPASINTAESAFFINDKQVTLYHINLTNAEYYTRILKSKQDTVIKGKIYKGTIRVYTNENFFANRTALPDLIKKYTGLPEDKVIVHWRGPSFRYTYEHDLGTIINDHFSLYSFEISPMGVKAIEVDSIQCAEGDRYVVHIVDNQYRWSKPKATTIFSNPMDTDTVAPCYVTDFDPEGDAIFVSTEIEPQPREGMEVFRKRLSSTMGIQVDKPINTGIRDSITVQFIVLRDGKLAALQSIKPASPEQQNILTAIKKTACIWMPAIQGGRSVIAWRLITIVYTKDKKEKIHALNSIVRKQILKSPPPPWPEAAPLAKPPIKVDTASLFPTEYASFKGYQFVINGTTIDKDRLVDYPKATLGRILPNDNQGKNRPQGVVYFNTPEYPPSPTAQYADDPAYFINDTQVSPYAIRSTRVSEYTHISRPEQDTLIDAIGYNGTIRLYTDENFFEQRLTMSEIIQKYTNLPLDKVIVHWRGQYIDALNPGLIIRDHFNLYYIDPRGLQELKIDRLKFAEGECYVVHMMDRGYRFNVFDGERWWPPARTYLIFDDPHAFDPAALCYLADFDTTGKTIHQRAKVESRPYPNEEVYLKKLSAIMGLTTTNKSTATIPDSITVQFIVLANGQLTGLESLSPSKVGQEELLKAIKQHSCVWPEVRDGRKYLLFRRKIVFFCSRDKKGNIRTLDRLEYRYDDKLP